ncbi:hypothetical protein BDQ12DRAFT_128757 [Crucibulum laeve]|uniref:Uncharacterized protein n=1 Tax=Crucibulum laeve TaxID=68775 RepID=A0A5C3LFW9_9AGAR|nr:hypothetical protein BDQ12DRAFT_128757 [Crucibulum laeve]
MTRAAKSDKWLNVETPYCNLFSKEEKEAFEFILLPPTSGSPPGPPPLKVQVLLAILELTYNRVLTYLMLDSSCLWVEPTLYYIFLALGSEFCTTRPGCGPRLTHYL